MLVAKHQAAVAAALLVAIRPPYNSKLSELDLHMGRGERWYDSCKLKSQTSSLLLMSNHWNSLGELMIPNILKNDSSSLKCFACFKRGQR